MVMLFRTGGFLWEGRVCELKRGCVRQSNDAAVDHGETARERSR